MKGFLNFCKRFWYAQNYAYCKSNEYLAANRGEGDVAGQWGVLASHWYLNWWRVGKELK